MSTSLVLRDKASIWHPFTQQLDTPPPIPIESGSAAILVAEDGREYIDAISSWWVNLHGHAHPYIAQKIYEQALKLEQVIFAGFTHLPAISLAEKLLHLLPHGFSKIFYSDNGSTATEVALKMALQYWWNKSEPRRKKIMAFTNSYHGDTFGAMSVSERGIFTLAFHDLLFDVIFIDPPADEHIEQQMQVVEEYHEELAAFIYEPIVQGAGGMLMHHAKGLDALISQIQARDIICIGDEVMTGFGRTGKFFASEWMNHVPDIICLSKGLTGGTMALGATACNQKIHSAFASHEKLKTFFHGHSFTANPLACSAALASLDLLEKEECKKNIQDIEKSNQQFIEELLPYARRGLIKNVRSIGTILAFEVNAGKDEYLNTTGPVVMEKALSKGVYIRPLGNTVYIMPPYCITEAQLSKVYRTIVEILEENPF